MIEPVTPTMLEKRLMQLGVFGYVASVVFCGVSYVLWQNTQILRAVLWGWSAVLVLYGLRLIIVRVGWVPTRRGPQVCSGRVAMVIGVLYVMFGVGLGGAAVVVASVL